MTFDSEAYERAYPNNRAAFYRTLYLLNKPIVDQLNRLWDVVMAHGLRDEVLALASSPSDDPPAANLPGSLADTLLPHVPAEPAPSHSAGNVLNPGEVADLYNVSIDVVYNWLHTGILPAVDLSTPGMRYLRAAWGHPVRALAPLRTDTPGRVCPAVRRS